jgi:hypothetical protein
MRHPGQSRATFGLKVCVFESTRLGYDGGKVQRGPGDLARAGRAKCPDGSGRRFECEFRHGLGHRQAMDMVRPGEGVYAQDHHILDAVPFCPNKAETIEHFKPMCECRMNSPQKGRLKFPQLVAFWAIFEPQIFKNRTGRGPLISKLKKKE